MGKTSTHEAIILRAMDVGEADRFCILLTRSSGRIAARARGVRKLKSHMGGTLLPLSTANITIREGSAGKLITGAQQLKEGPTNAFQGFLQAQQGAELLLSLLHDDEPIEHVFDAASCFFELCSKGEECYLPFSLYVLSQLGMLPSYKEGELARKVTEEEIVFLECITHDKWVDTPELSTPAQKRMQLLSNFCIEHAGTVQMKAMEVAKQMV